MNRSKRTSRMFAGKRMLTGRMNRKGRGMQEEERMARREKISLYLVLCT